MAMNMIRAAAPAAFVFLSACGGGGGGGGSTAPEPVPPPPATASAFPLTTSGTFNAITAARSYTRPSGEITVDRFGVSARSSNAVISYDATTNNYTVADGPATASFSASQLTTSGFIDTYAKQEGALTDKLQLYNNVRSGASQASAPVQLNYLSYGVWSRKDVSTLDKYTTTYLLFGYPTANSSMPKSGSATYKTAVIANTVNIGMSFNERETSGTATFTADFASAAVKTDLNLNLDSDPLAPVKFTGAGTISGNQFGGDFTSTDPWFVSGSFAGGFFGSSADEMGYTFAIKRGSPDPYAGATMAPALGWTVGAVVGEKN